MGAKFVQISAAVLETMLGEKGFRRTVSGSEVVYVRESHKHPGVKIKVYTSLPVSGGQVRAAGRDAIRVAAAYEWHAPVSPRHGAAPSSSFGIYRAKRIYRVGTEEDVLNRLYERMRETYAYTNEWCNRNWKILAETHPDARPRATK